MNFWKMNGAGNDFIIINNIEERLPAGRFPLLAQKLCDRHMSVGADGLMIEVHNNPECALCDGAQSLKPEKYADLIAQVKQIAEVVGKLL